MTQPSSATDGRLGRAFAQALSRGELEQAAALLHPEIDFRALTPRRAWEAGDDAGVLDVLRTWFAGAEVTQVTHVETDEVADRRRIAYRFHGSRPDGPFVIEQQAYYSARDDRIDWLRILCSGFRPGTGA